MLASTYDPAVLGLEIVGVIGDHEVRVRCPYHDDRNPSAEYSIAKGLFYCFGCHESRTAAQVARDMGGRLVPMSPATMRRFRDRARATEVAWRSLLHAPVAADNEYLERRGVTDSIAARYDLRSYRDGIVIPIRDRFERVTGVQVRHYERRPKYMIYGNRQPLWPLHRLVHATASTRFVVEGVFGVLRAASAGFAAYATMGSHGVADAARLLRPGSRLIAHFVGESMVIMDPDLAGYVAAGQWVLHGFPVLVGHEAPPDEWSREEWLRVSREYRDLMTLDVMDVIAASPNPDRVRYQLERYWLANFNTRS